MAFRGSRGTLGTGHTPAPLGTYHENDIFFKVCGASSPALSVWKHHVGRKHKHFSSLTELGYLHAFVVVSLFFPV